jgi:hypothetical protein
MITKVNLIGYPAPVTPKAARQRAETVMWHKSGDNRNRIDGHRMEVVGKSPCIARRNRKDRWMAPAERRASGQIDETTSGKSSPFSIFNERRKVLRNE